MASQEARALVEALIGAGWTRGDIAAVLDRDVGMIGQIARGARSAGYGQTLVPALRQLQTTGTTVPPPRRVTAAGTPARVRQPVTRIPGATTTVTAARFGTIPERELNAAAASDRQVSMRVTFTDGSTRNYWTKGGYSARKAQGDIASAGGSFATAFVGWHSDSPYGDDFDPGDVDDLIAEIEWFFE